MALNEYRYNSGTYQFDDEDAPIDAERIEPIEAKVRIPKNKAAAASTKSGE